MDPCHMERLKEEYVKGLDTCTENIARWSKFKDDYETLQRKLTELPNKLSYDITIPFGSNAFVEGKLIHTNEVTVLLGDGWFADVSAKQASEIANRRIAHCNKMLEDLEKEKDQFQNWLNYANEVSTNDDLVEIVEKYDEEEEAKWREQHSKNVKEYRKKLREEKADASSESNHMDDEFCMEFNYLDLTEEESESKSVQDSENSTFDYSDDGSMYSESPKNPPQFFPHDNLILSDEMRSINNHDLPCSSSPDDDHETGCEKHVQWQDLTKKNLKKITFKHSRCKKTQVKISSPTEENEAPLIQSPSDIYKQFESFFPASPPKSILKVKHSPPVSCPFTEPPFIELGSCAIKTEPTIESGFIGEVVEHSDSSFTYPPLEKKPLSRPVSHFKNSRKHKKK